RDDGDRPYETVTLAHDGFEEPRRIGIVPESPPDLPHRRVDGRVRVDEHVLAPEALEDLGSIHELSPTLGEQGEQLHGKLLELFHAAAAAQLVARQVKLDHR